MKFSFSEDYIPLYVTHEHVCSYLSNEVAKTLLVDPDKNLDYNDYQRLLSIGFRRSGNMVYRPNCSDCKACISVRIPVADFKPRRNQRRCWQRNHNLQVILRPAEFDQEHYDLYLHYMSVRHHDGGMANLTPALYIEFLTTRWNPTLFVEFRHNKQLLAVAVTDLLPNSLSAVYTFFNP
ncbi:hypothetical protein TI03_02640, partial [Achromatium sp. WMS1]